MVPRMWNNRQIRFRSSRLVRFERTPWVPAPPRREAGETLQHWIYRTLREPIAEGRLAPGTPVPSSRRLAADLGISRGTVVLACEQLVTEGYLVSRPGAGMAVSPQVPDRAIAPRPAARHAAPPGAVRAIGAVPGPFTSPPAPIAFAPHRCETRALPVDVLRRLHGRLLRRANPWLFADGPAAGLPELRRAIAAYLGEARGLAVHEDQVLVVASMQQALDVALRVLTSVGDPVWVEDPGYPGVRRLVEATGRTPVFVPVDERGLRVEAGVAAAPGARLACVTPSRHAPLGVPLALARRAALLDWARRTGGVIFEDDYDSEHRFGSRPVRPLAADDPSRVLLAGSFSKVLYPGLRIAYLVCPPAWLDAFAATLSLGARHPNLLVQAVLSRFIDEGHLARHVRRMRRLYLERAQAFDDAARRHWAGLLEVPALQAGLDVTVRLLRAGDDRDAARRLRAAGVECMPLAGYRARAELPPALVMGFAAVDEHELAEAAPRVARALSDPDGANGTSRTSSGGRPRGGRASIAP